MQNAAPPLCWRLAIVILPLSTGTGLVAYSITQFSLPLGIALTALVGAGAAAWVWRRSSPDARIRIRRRTAIGAAAGILATISYDLARFAVVNTLPMEYRPSVSRFFCLQAVPQVTEHLPVGTVARKGHSFRCPYR